MAGALLAMGIGCESAPKAPSGGSPPDWPVVEIRRLGIEVWEQRAYPPFLHVFRVSPGAPAEQQGLQSGDVLCRVGGEVVRRAADVERALDRFSPGDAVPVTLNQWEENAPKHTVTLLPGPEAILGIGVADDEVLDGTTYVNHALGLTFALPSKEWGALRSGAGLLWTGSDPSDMGEFSSKDQAIFGCLHVYEMSMTLAAFAQNMDKWATDYMGSQGGTFRKLSSENQGGGQRLEGLFNYPAAVHHGIYLLFARGKLNCSLQLWTAENLWNSRKGEIDGIARTFAWTDQRYHCIVSKVSDNSPASKADLQKGDGLLAINGRTVLGNADFHKQIAAVSPGQEVTIEFERQGERRRVRVLLAASPSPLSYRNPPGWENAREVEELYSIDTEFGIFGWKPGSACWVKAVFMPGPEGVTAKINRLHKAALVGSLIDPERYQGGPLYPGCQPIDPRAFIRGGRSSTPVKLGASTLQVQPDIVYLQAQATLDRATNVWAPPKRLFILELYREQPGNQSIPFRSLLLGEREGIIASVSPWKWRDPKSIVVFEEGRLWNPEWKVEKDQIASIAFKERALSATEVFKLSPFEGVAPGELTGAIIRWKNTDFDPVLREAKTTDLREYAAGIEQTILAANAASEREKDLAQRLIEKGQPGAEPHAERSRSWRARIEVLKPILAAIKDEVANRGK